MSASAMNRMGYAGSDGGHVGAFSLAACTDTSVRSCSPTEADTQTKD